MTSPKSLIGLPNPNHTPRNTLKDASDRAILATLKAPETSAWLYDCLMSALNRGPLDAAIDAQRLANLLAARHHAVRMGDKS